MTITSSDIGPWEYLGDGVTTAFQYNNKILAASDILPHLDGVLQAAGFTVSGVGAAAGGNVTFAVAPAAGVAVKLIRRVPSTQPTKYPAAGPFPSESHEDGLDRAMILVQQIQVDLARMLQFDETDQGLASAVLPAKATLANKALGFDNTGKPKATQSTVEQIDAVVAAGVAIGATLQEFTFTADGATAAFTLANLTGLTKARLLVFLDGLITKTADYTLAEVGADTELTFTFTPGVDAGIIVRTL